MNFEDTSNWHVVILNTWKEFQGVSDEWLRDNIKDKHSYTCFGYYWYFKNQDDATMFALTWKE